MYTLIDSTRVSFDLRVIPRFMYQKYPPTAKGKDGKLMFGIGEYYLQDEEFPVVDKDTAEDVELQHEV